jgi:single-strand DNA-binding protein
MGADPEVRYSAKGTQIVSFNVAVNQVRKGPDGERQESTEWFRVRVSGYQTEFAQRLSKGTRVLVMGRLDISHYQSRDGEPRTGFDVWAEEVQTMSARGANNESEGLPDGESEAPEPALAGVSSPASSTAGRTSANGKGGRSTSRPNAESPGSGSAEDLEDLPF